jgi:MFS family permease
MCRTLLQAVSLIGCFGVAYFIKKFGRKQLIQIGAFLIAIILVIIGICFGSNTATAKNTIVALLYIFIILFNFTLGPLVWLYIPEILQPKWVPFTTMVNWGASVITILLFPIIVNMFGSPLKIFFGLGIWCFIAGVINHFYMV